jgi:hypothetical protein
MSTSETPGQNPTGHDDCNKGFTNYVIIIIAKKAYEFHVEKDKF